MKAVLLIIVLLHTACGSVDVNEMFELIKDGDFSRFSRLLIDNEMSLAQFINTKEEGSGQTPLMMAILMGKRKFVKLLLGFKEVDVTIPEKDGYTAMHGAGFQGRAKILKLLVQDNRNIDPSSRHSDGYTPLHRACWGNEERHADTVKMFVKKGGVHYEEKTGDGKTCMEITNNKATKKWLRKWKSREESKADL